MSKSQTRRNPHATPVSPTFWDKQPHIGENVQKQYQGRKGPWREPILAQYKPKSWDNLKNYTICGNTGGHTLFLLSFTYHN